MFYYESQVLASLEFNASRVLTIDFINLFAFDAGFGQKDKRRYFALYLLNTSYLSPNLCSIRKSLLAFSIIYFVNKIFGKGKEWPRVVNDKQHSKHQDNKENDAPQAKTMLSLFFENRMQPAEQIRKEFEQRFKFEAIGHDTRLRIQEEGRSNVDNNQSLKGCSCQGLPGNLSHPTTCTLQNPSVFSNANNNAQIHPTLCSNRILSLASENLHLDTTSADLRTQQNSQNNNEITSSGRAKDSTECSTGLPVQKFGVEKQLKKISSFRIINPKASQVVGRELDKGDAGYLLALPMVQFEVGKVKNIAMDVFQSNIFYKIWDSEL